MKTILYLISLLLLTGLSCFNIIAQIISRNIRYKYRVNNGEWVNGNQVTLQSLRPGSYEIVMEGRDLEDMTTFAHNLIFTVKPPFWRTVWFINAIQE